MTGPIEEWLRHGWYLYRLRASARRYERIAQHWAALSLEAIKVCEDPDALEELAHLADLLHLKPHRGRRGGTKWELVNMTRLNRIKQIERERDWDSMRDGENYRRAAA